MLVSCLLIPFLMHLMQQPPSNHFRIMRSLNAPCSPSVRMIKPLTLFIAFDMYDISSPFSMLYAMWTYTILTFFCSFHKFKWLY